MDNLDHYLEALRSMPNASGKAVRAMDHAEAVGLAPLEFYLAGDLARAVDEGVDRTSWITAHQHLAEKPVDLEIGNSSMPNRLTQALANLMDAGLWPW